MLSDDELAKRNHSIRQNRLELFRRLGARVGWCFCPTVGYWGLRLKYWIIRKYRQYIKDVNIVPIPILKQPRSLHWSRTDEFGK